MSGKRRILKHNNSVNSIDAHEDCIAQALSDNSFRLNSINNRINVFQQDKKETTRSAKEIEWKKLFLSLEHEERAIMQDLQSISENIVPGGNTTYSMNPNESDAILSLRLESTASQILQDLEGKPAEEKNNYLAAGVELDSEFDSIEQEVVLLKELVRHNCRNNIGILSNRLHLPTIVAKRLDEVKEEFRFAPQDLALDTYIDQVSNQIEENFRHVSNDQVYTRKEDREGTIHAKPAKWDERSQMILRNAMKQWSKNTTNYDKQRFLQQVAKETGKDITICKQMWHFLHSQNGRGRNGKISENERCWNDLTKIALEDIDIVRQNVINELVSDYQRYLSTEIGIESSHKLRLLQSLRTLSEERRRGDEERLQILQCEEERVLLSKRIAEREAAGRKLEMYLMDKENGNRQARVDEMKMLEEEEIDRARRLAVNSERTQFRRELMDTRAKTNQERMENEEREEIARQQRLRALASSVPYHSTIKNIKSNIQKTTESRMNDVYEPSSDTGLTDFQMGKLKSFTNERVFSDPKFRLGFALHEKGLASTAYAVAVMKHLIPRETERTTGIQPY